jgi:radical SAM superfamily enzyme YgiQ (UPF0313 family)
MELCKKHSILANSAFLFGIPGETVKDLQETIDFVRKYDVFSTGVNIMKPLPGSPYYYRLVGEGAITPDIKEWREISDINVKGKIYNPIISEDDYYKYISIFNSTIQRKTKINHFKCNFLKYLKYYFGSDK